MNLRFRIGLIALLTIPPLGLITTRPAAAQDTAPPPAATAPAAPTGQDDEAPLSDRRPRPLGDIVRRMSRTAGVQIVTDSQTAKLTVAPPAEATTPENFESQLTALAKALPGTTWGRLMLPDRHGRFDGDAVAAYAQAEARLFGRVGEKTKPGEVEIMGQHLAAEKAEVHITGLNLVPVYLITGADGRAAGGPADPNRWSGLSPQEKRQYAQQQAAQLAAADPNLRNAIAQQYFMIFNQLLRQMSPTDRQSLFSGMSAPGENVRVILREDGGKLPPNVIVTPVQ